MVRIVLIGMPGAGKTTVGKALAKALSLPFVDADKELVARTGVSISTIFEIEGEPGFRRREAALIRDLMQRDSMVLATGGGAVLDPATRQLMHDSSMTIYLRATLDALIERTKKDSARPLLANGNLLEKLTSMLAIREPLYIETAHLTFDTGKQSPARLANTIAKTIESRLDPDSRVPQ